MEAATVSDGEMLGGELPPEEGEEADNMEKEEMVREMLDEVVREMLDEMVRESAEEALEEGVQELARLLLWELLDDESGDVVEQFYQELLDSALSSSQSSNLEECQSPEEEEMQEEFDGILTEKGLVKGLSNLSRTAAGSELAYCRLSLPNYELHDITILYNYTHLQRLELPHNHITDLRCVGRMPYLLQLDASHNQLSSLADLKLPQNIKRGNKITNVTGLAQMGRLHKLDLSDNRIESLNGMENHDLLETINLEKNQIRELNEIKHMQNLPLLRVLNLLWNPIQEHPDYLFWTLFMVQKLTELDYKKVKATDKVLAINKYNPPAEVVAASDHMTHIMYGFQQHQKIYDSTLPNLDIPYPMLVLVGPQACGKRELAHMLCQEFSDYFGYCICHTSRSPYFGEEDGCDYHFVTEQTFQEMIQLGKFIETIKYNGNYFGLSREALEAVAREGLACCIHMELEGVRSLKKTYLEPRYILLIPMKTEEHQRRLHLRGLYTKSQIDFATSRVESYISMNQDYPGYFDAVISSDNLMHAYLQLSQLLREYLSLSNQASNDIDRVIKGDKWQASDLPKSTPTESNHSNWSKSSPSNGLSVGFLDSSTRNYSSRIQARLSAEKTHLEQCSIERRQKMAREAVKGQAAGPYTSLFKRVQNISYITSTSGIISDFTSYTSLIPIASSTDYDQTSRSSSDLTSSEATHSTPRVSSFSSAEVFSEIIKPIDLDTDSSTDIVSQALLSEYKFLAIPGDRISSLTLEEGLESYKELKVTSKYPSVQNIQIPSPRLGSNNKPILPPIPSGRTRAEIPEGPQQAACTAK
ncbi:leucine-rich repeat and guanylate kinase domain-containing protein isoform X2 [Scyliorhinus torazame]|uniref:leucine-rich repeat and guanylate kinase domain-containing protein isoform X2 n=1 Tax=Scyliorhinus torazame TaxID=75743 RepID=UPI003B5B20E5